MVPETGSVRVQQRAGARVSVLVSGTSPAGRDGGRIRVDTREQFDAAVRVRGPALLRVAYQLTHHRADAEDVVQAALVRVYSSVRRRGELPDDLGAYLRRAVVNEFLRGRRRSSSSELVVDELPEVGVADATGVVGERDALWLALGGLSTRQRAALVLRHYEDLDDVAIAAALGCRRATVRSLCARGLAALRPALTDPAEEATTP